MPTYDYQCAQCGHQAEAFQKITEDALVTCPVCHKQTYARRPGRGVGISFVGSGFYSNDYGPNKQVSNSDQGASCCPCGKNQGKCDTKK